MSYEPPVTASQMREIKDSNRESIKKSVEVLAYLDRFDRRFKADLQTLRAENVALKDHVEVLSNVVNLLAENHFPETDQGAQ
jgi:hypothetical protein